MIGTSEKPSIILKTTDDTLAEIEAERAVSQKAFDDTHDIIDTFRETAPLATSIPYWYARAKVDDWYDFYRDKPMTDFTKEIDKDLESIPTEYHFDLLQAGDMLEYQKQLEGVKLQLKAQETFQKSGVVAGFGSVAVASLTNPVDWIMGVGIGKLYNTARMTKNLVNIKGVNSNIKVAKAEAKIEAVAMETMIAQKEALIASFKSGKGVSPDVMTNVGIFGAGGALAGAVSEAEIQALSTQDWDEVENTALFGLALGTSITGLGAMFRKASTDIGFDYSKFHKQLFSVDDGAMAGIDKFKLMAKAGTFESSSVLGKVATSPINFMQSAKMKAFMSRNPTVANFVSLIEAPNWGLTQDGKGVITHGRTASKVKTELNGNIHVFLHETQASYAKYSKELKDKGMKPLSPVEFDRKVNQKLNEFSHKLREDSYNLRKQAELNADKHVATLGDELTKAEKKEIHAEMVKKELDSEIPKLDSYNATTGDKYMDEYIDASNKFTTAYSDARKEFNQAGAEFDQPKYYRHVSYNGANIEANPFDFERKMQSALESDFEFRQVIREMEDEIASVDSQIANSMDNIEDAVSYNDVLSDLNKAKKELKDTSVKLEKAYKKQRDETAKIKSNPEEIFTGDELKTFREHKRNIAKFEKAETNIFNLRSKLSNAEKNGTSTKKIQEQITLAEKEIKDLDSAHQKYNKFLEKQEPKMKKVADSRIAKEFGSVEKLVKKKETLSKQMDTAVKKFDDRVEKASNKQVRHLVKEKKRLENELESTRKEPEEMSKAMTHKIIQSNNLAEVHDFKHQYSSTTPQKSRVLKYDHSTEGLEQYLHNGLAKSHQDYNFAMRGRLSTNGVLGIQNKQELEQILAEMHIGGSDSKQIMDIYDMATETRAIDPKKGNLANTVARGIQKVNYLALGGMFAVNGAGEFGAGVMAGGWRYAVATQDAFDMTKRLYKHQDIGTMGTDILHMGIAGDIAEGSAMLKYADIDNINSTWFGDELLSKGSQKMFRMSGLEGITTLTRVAVPASFLGRIIKQLKADPSMTKELARLGFTPEDLLKLREVPVKMNKFGVIQDFNFGAWGDADMVKRVKSSLAQIANDSVLEASSLNLPSFMTAHNPAFNLMTQFMSFSVMSTERLLVRGIDENLARTFVGALTSFLIVGNIHSLREDLEVATGLREESKRRFDITTEEGFMNIAKKNGYAGIIGMVADLGDALMKTGQYRAGEEVTRSTGGLLASRVSQMKTLFDTGFDPTDPKTQKVGASIMPFYTLLGANSFINHLLDSYKEDHDTKENLEKKGYQFEQ